MYRNYNNEIIIPNYKGISPEITTEELHQLVDDSETSVEILRGIWKNAADKKINLQVICGLARNQSTPPDILYSIWDARVVRDDYSLLSAYRPALYTKIDASVICMIVQNQNTSSLLLEDIWAHSEEYLVTSAVLLRVVKNPNTPLPTLFEIWNSKDDEEKKTPEITPEIISALEENHELQEYIRCLEEEMNKKMSQNEGKFETPSIQMPISTVIQTATSSEEFEESQEVARERVIVRVNERENKRNKHVCCCQ